jgi:hypothetical protein
VSTNYTYDIKDRLRTVTDNDGDLPLGMRSAQNLSPPAGMEEGSGADP